ncbi:MAG: hypothetical protein V4590_14655 [Bacteroidota bacterium]
MKSPKIVMAILAIAGSIYVSNAQQWNTSGNSVSSGEFLGTTNAYPLILKSNNTELGLMTPGAIHFGSNNVLFGSGYAFGKDIIIDSYGNNSFAIGEAISLDEQNSYAFGRNIVNASSAMVIGFGISSSNPLTSGVTNSLSIGFNSTIPTFFVGPSTGVGTTGNVGIGTTTPSAKLEVASPYAYNASGTVVKLGGKGSWNTNDYERFQLGFSQLQSIYNGTGWDLSFNTGSSNGVGVEALRIKSNGNILFSNPNTPVAFAMNMSASGGIPSGVWFYPETSANLSLFADGASGASGKGINILAYNGTWHTGLKYANTGSGGAVPTLVLQESNGKVGIGTANPNAIAKLQVNGGDVVLGNDINGERWVIHTRKEQHSDMLIFAPDLPNATWDWNKSIGIQRSSGKMFIGDITPNTPNMPGNYRLYVRDGILAEKVKVALFNTASWADYVFKEDYTLLSLNEVERFVKEHKHLPGVPSDKEVVANGIDVAEMDATLLKKIEELTLYMIDQNKRLEKLEKENAELKKSIKQ